MNAPSRRPLGWMTRSARRVIWGVLFLAMVGHGFHSHDMGRRYGGQQAFAAPSSQDYDGLCSLCELLQGGVDVCVASEGCPPPTFFADPVSPSVEPFRLVVVARPARAPPSAIA